MKIARWWCSNTFSIAWWPYISLWCVEWGKGTVIWRWSLVCGAFTWWRQQYDVASVRTKWHLAKFGVLAYSSDVSITVRAWWVFVFVIIHIAITEKYFKFLFQMMRVVSTVILDSQVVIQKKDKYIEKIELSKVYYSLFPIGKFLKHWCKTDINVVTVVTNKDMIDRNKCDLDLFLSWLVLLRGTSF